MIKERKTGKKITSSKAILIFKLAIKKEGKGDVFEIHRVSPNGIRNNQAACNEFQNRPIPVN
ncbi:MAG: hypothetical protein ABI761_06950 [Saprospiraceae bacterium]